ncbi:MAG TPA: lytic transglycosylase, partial [Acidobacteriaceae bacterium]
MTDRSTAYRVAVLLICLHWPGDSLVAKAAASAVSGQSTATTKKKTPAKSAKGHAATAGTGKKSSVPTSRKKSRAPVKASSRQHKPRVAPTARSIKLTSAFLASTQLRPMAQQLAATRSTAAYSGVLSYAQSHPGEGAAAAYLALGHAYMLDHRYADAATHYNQAKRAGEALDDYADYLGAQAAIQAGRAGDAYAILDHFADRYPDSIFDDTAPILLANAHLQQNDAKGALAVLEPLVNTPGSEQVGFRYALGRSYQLAGDTAHAAPIFRKIYQAQPLAYEATEAAAQLQAMGAPLTAAERKAHADALFNAKRYSDASAEYNAIGKNNPALTASDRDALTIYTAVCDFKLKHLSRRDIERLPETGDDTAALKLYMLAELSRNEDDRNGHDALISQMLSRYPASRWLEEALYSGGNMYLLKHDAKQAIYHYALL